MGNFSRDPLHELLRGRARGYVGVHVEQGVPVLDRDLNLLGDLVRESVREILARHLGDGVAERNDAFAIEAVPAAGDFRVCAPPEGGACLVGGIQVTLDAPLRYLEQPGAAPLTTPAEEDRTDLVYLDVWVEEVGAAADAELENGGDVGVQTSVRLRPAWRVRVAEGTRHLPPAACGHAHAPLAMLDRPRGEEVVGDRMIVDLRRTGLNLADLARRVQRLEDVLFSPAPEWLAPPPEPRPEAPPARRATAWMPPRGAPAGTTEPATSRREYAT